MKHPVTGPHLHKLLCALQWIKSTVPDFSVIIDHLDLFMERLYESAGTPDELFRCKDLF